MEAFPQAESWHTEAVPEGRCISQTIIANFSGSQVCAVTHDAALLANASGVSGRSSRRAAPFLAGRGGSLECP